MLVRMSKDIEIPVNADIFSTFLEKLSIIFSYYHSIHHSYEKIMKSMAIVSGFSHRAF